jgi:pyrimidine-nucleoside phosphorylase
MLLLGSPDRAALDPTQAAARVREVIVSGAALSKFREFVVAQGGDGARVDDPAQLPTAPVQTVIPAPTGGNVQRVESRTLGLAAVDLGGGRQKKGDPIDYRVGLVLHVKVGDRVEAGAPLCTVHAAHEAAAAALHGRVQAAFHLQEAPVKPLPIVYERVAAAYQGV